MASTDRFAAPGGGLVVHGLDAFLRELRKVDPTLAKASQKALKNVSTQVAARGKSTMSRFHKGAEAAAGVRPRARQKSASIALLGSNKFVRAAEFGTRYHFLPWGRGRSGGRKLTAGVRMRRVFPPWVGNQFDGGDWIDGLHGRQGHAVQPAIQRWIDSGGALDTLEEMYERAFRDAYPSRI